MDIEFYLDFTGTFKKVINFKLDNREWTSFQKLTPEEIEVIFNHLVTFPKARKGLLLLSRFYPGDKKKILHQYIMCNWTRLNNTMDVTTKKLNFEKVYCPFKSTGNCPFEGKGTICIKF